MGDLTQTPANVLPSSSAEVARIEGLIIGATITAGMPCYQDSGDSDKVKPADFASQAEAAVVGIAENGGGPGQRVSLITFDPALDLGATLVVGEYYIISAAGKIREFVDKASTQWITGIGLAISTSAVYYNAGAWLIGPQEP